MLITVTLMLGAVDSAAVENDTRTGPQIGYSIEVQDYTWKEFDESGSKLLEESGYLYGAAFDFDSRRNILGWRTGITLFSGQVDYEGLTWALTPVKTDVFYMGTRLYVDLIPNYRFSNDLLLKTFGGIGFSGWLRDLEDTQTQDGAFVSGAEEWWWSVYGRVGAGASYPVSNAFEIFSEAGTKIPIYSVNHANLYVSGTPSVDLEPEMRFSPFADLGVRWNQFVVKVSYDTLWFDKSDSVSASGLYTLHQPESEADIIRLSIAWTLTF